MPGGSRKRVAERPTESRFCEVTTCRPSSLASRCNSAGGTFKPTCNTTSLLKNRVSLIGGKLLKRSSPGPATGRNTGGGANDGGGVPGAALLGRLPGPVELLELSVPVGGVGS